MTIPEPVESFTEWGVRWQGGFWSPPTQGLFKAEDACESAARKFAAGLHPGYNAVVVCRTVTCTEWEEVDSDA